jgi:hypothetical protein
MLNENHTTKFPLDAVSEGILACSVAPFKPSKAAELIAAELSVISPAGAAALANCGHFPISRARPIAVYQGTGAGGLSVGNLRRCRSRRCPICGPQIRKQLANIWAARAAQASEKGCGAAMLRFSLSRCEPGELAPMLTELLCDFKRAVPPLSRWPSAPSGWLGGDWSTEIDFDAEARTWHPHIHMQAFRVGGGFTPGQLDDLKARGFSYAELSASPVAVARYNAKARNAKAHILGLIDLAELGLVDQVAEYLAAIHGRRLRASSRLLSAFVGLPGGDNDAALAGQALRVSTEQTPLRIFSAVEWRSALTA